jgi:hydroxylamine reductase
MFCYQCEQTLRTPGTVGCNTLGICGKDNTTSNLQDLLIHALTGLGIYAAKCNQLEIYDQKINGFTVEALFATLTNVNFDASRIQELLMEAVQYRQEMKSRYIASCEAKNITPELSTLAPAEFIPATNINGLLEQADAIGFDVRSFNLDADITGLYGLVLFGLKGLAAYTEHARVLDQNSQEVYAKIYECLAFLATESTDANEYLGWALQVGATNYKTMELLDTAHTTTFGNPEPTQARITAVKGKAILVSGHDLLDLQTILEQTAGKGINVYTHGELLPALAYPVLKKYPHLIGNFGGAWQDQQTDFANFPGSIVMTTNCIIEPKLAYSHRIFTRSVVGWSGVKHLPTKDFTPAIEAALAAPGFAEDEEAKFITIGFGRNTVLSVAPQVIDAVKAGAIKHFFLIGGCDGAKTGRNYFTEFAHQVPQDCVILTLGCGKYRFNKEEFGDIGGIPRLLDMGQCSDSYGAIQVALALAGAFNCGVNDLPLSLIISWFEQKAAAVLLTLLFLGVENIHLGPTLPAFLTPNVVNILVEKFKLRPTGVASEDLARIMHA